MEEQSIHTFSVDLKKEESIAFALLHAKVCGPLRQRTFSLVLSGGLFLMMAGMLVWDWVEAHTIDPIMVIATLLMVLPALFSCFFLPANIKKRAAKQYDQAIKAGNTFCGELRIYPDRVEKQTESVCAKIPLNAHTLFIESAEMMAFVSPYAPAVVLPARCATDDMAAALRQAADTLPMTNRRFIARLQPKGEPVTLPGTAEKPEVLWECKYTYTPEEYMVVGRQHALFRFWKMSPILGLFSLLIGLTLGWDGQSLLPTVLYFLLTLAVVTLLNLVLPLRRIRRAAHTVGQKERTTTLTIDRVAVRIKVEGSGEALLLWEDDVHVYDKPPFAEFARKRDTLVFLPKRCIPDVTAFDEVINRCRSKQ